MARKDRHYDEIIKGCEELKAAIDDLQHAAQALEAGAASTEASLKDRVGKQDIALVKEFAAAIKKATAGGSENAEALKKKTEREREEYNAMQR